jgi:hypothetical protein
MSFEEFVSALLDGAPLACPATDAIWVDWITAQAKATGFRLFRLASVAPNCAFC